MLLVGMMLTLVSCAGGIDNGSYASASGETVEIDGNKYTATVNKGGYSFKVTYTYEKVEGGFVVNGTKYTKK